LAAATEEQRHTAEVAPFTIREAALMEKDSEDASRVAALDAHAHDLADWEEAAHREAAVAAAAKDRAAVIEQQARDRVSAAVLDTTAKVKDAQTLLDAELWEAARSVADAEAVATDATARAAAAEEKAARLEAAAQEATRVVQ